MSQEPPRVLGIDVGGTKIAAAPLSGGAPGAVVTRPTDISGTEALLDGIEAAAREAMDGEIPAAVGVGVPSQVEHATGTVVASVNIPLAGIALREELSGRLGAPVVVDNDANCAALAEAQLTEGGPARFLVMLTLGTGVGGGLVIDGRIFRGARGLGAELGHIVVDAEGPECPGACPNRGCLEALCSGTALERDATAVGAEHPDSALGRVAAASGGRVSGRDAVAAARDGEPDAVALLQRLGRWLGVGMAGLVNAFEPEDFVIGGGLSAAADLFLDTARAEMEARALPAVRQKVRVSVARGGNDAGVIGAGLLAAQELAAAPADRPATVSEGIR